jgi:hypothetical protein
MIASLQSTSYFSGSLSPASRSSKVNPRGEEAIVTDAAAARSRRNDEALRPEVGAPGRSTRQMVTFDEKGQLLFQMIDSVTQEVERQYPDAVFLRIR